MSDDVAIRVKNLGKRYKLGQKTGGYKTLGETITRTVKAPFQRLQQRKSSEEKEEAGTFWALRDVSFEVKKGEAIGIIGRNGAGKSTLLKILSRITSPTEGTVEINGRIGSLLEVGTGFHPELSGRENVFLSGSIMGMKKAEIEEKFDQIVKFAEIEKFLDTPVKRYSSGMYVRLAFAVAAHLEPEILIVDEVLAVGDAEFQKKCLGKMGDVASEGRTVLFVSHNMNAITRLCDRTILLDNGQIIADGPSTTVVGEYLRSDLGTRAERIWTDIKKAPGNQIVRLCGIRVRNSEGIVSETINIRESISIEMEFIVLNSGSVLVPNYFFFNDEGIHMFAANDHDSNWMRTPRPVGRYISTVTIPGDFFSEGTVIIEAAISTMNPVVIHFDEKDAVAFQITDSLNRDGSRGDYAGPMPGVIRPLFSWKTNYYPKK